MRSFGQALLEDYGLTTDFRRLGSVWSVSSDGLAFAGNGIDANGEPAGFYVLVPEPTSDALLGACVLGLVALRRASPRG